MTSVARRREHEESADYSDASQDIELNISVNDGVQQESDYDSQGSDSEHSDQDTENKEGERRVDDDEDRSNPQYIPKKGTFYEHDDRTAGSGEESSNATSEAASEKKEGPDGAPQTERRRPPRKSEIVNKWSHDKFNENEQMPKSRDELVSIYGYDIRNEDAPPHARRNRRYGRGPNKYTRTWEDEEAYRRQAAAPAAPRKPPGLEDFPELDPAKRQTKPRAPRPRSKSQPSPGESPDSSELRRSKRLPRNTRTTPRRARLDRPERQDVRQDQRQDVRQDQRQDVRQDQRQDVRQDQRQDVRQDRQERADRVDMPALENLTITASVNNNNQGQAQRKVNAVAQQRPVPTDQGKRKPSNNAQPSPQTNPQPNKSPPQQQSQKSQQQNQQQPPSGGSKRYSSLRQRPLGDSYTPQAPAQQQKQPAQQQKQPAQQQQQPTQQQPGQQQQQQQQQQHRYIAGPGEFVGGAHAAPQQHAHPQHIIHQQTRANATAAPHAPSPPQPHAPQVRLNMLDQQQMAAVQHPHHTIHNIPQPHNMGQIQPAQGYAPPAMMPAQYMQQSGSGAVFSGAIFPGGGHAPPPHAAHAPPHTAHAPPHAAHAPQHATHAPPHAAHAPPHAPPHPTYQHQIYAPHHNYAGGVTYYSCVEQEPPAPQPRPQRRPTAAIPIVSPHHSDRAANSSEKDNIDRIVENMFVRKPWPATHGADSKDKQPENRSSQEPASKESSAPNSLTSSSISTDSKPSESREEKAEEVKEVKEVKEVEKKVESEEIVSQDSISTDA